MGPPGGPRVRPLGWWYLVPAALAALACVVCVVAIVRGFEDARDAGLQASAAAPGVDQTLTITDPGGYTLAYSGPILVRSTAEKERLAEELELSIAPADGGAELVLRPYEGLNDLEQDGQQYVPLLTVRFDETGDYVLRSAAAVGVDRERSALVVSESPYGKLRSGAERAVVFLVVGLGLALLVTVILARTRGRSRAALRAQLPPPAQWPQPVPHGAPPPGGWRAPQQGPWAAPPPGGGAGPQQGWGAPPPGGGAGPQQGPWGTPSEPGGPGPQHGPWGTPPPGGSGGPQQGWGAPPPGGPPGWPPR